MGVIGALCRKIWVKKVETKLKKQDFLYVFAQREINKIIEVIQAVDGKWLREGKEMPHVNSERKLWKITVYPGYIKAYMYDLQYHYEYRENSVAFSEFNLRELSHPWDVLATCKFMIDLVETGVKERLKKEPPHNLYKLSRDRAEEVSNRSEGGIAVVSYNPNYIAPKKWL